MRRPPRTALRRALVIPACLAMAGATLAGCALDAGSAAVDQFKASLSGTPGVLAVSGGAHNDLPFTGTMEPEMLLDREADDATLQAATRKALAFRPAANAGVRIEDLHLQLGGVLDRADAAVPADPAAGSVVAVRVPWGKPADATLHAMIEVAAMPDVAAYLDDRIHTGRDANAELVTRRADTACTTLASVAAAFGREPNTIMVSALVPPTMSLPSAGQTTRVPDPPPSTGHDATRIPIPPADTTTFVRCG